jgi:hypothetical protein
LRTLAYSDPSRFRRRPIAGLKTHSHGALNVFKHEDDLVVINVKSILSVVAMVLFEQNDGGRRSFLIEKFALGVISSE